MKRISTAIIGATGYTGIELIRLILGHPNFHLTIVASQNNAGQSLCEIHPFLQGLPESDIIIRKIDLIDIAEKCALIFLAVPHGTAMPLVATLLDQNIKIVDLSADFRLKDSATYSQWYTLKHLHPTLLSKATYGIPEIYESKIACTNLVANPGCYPTAAILGLFPVLKHRIIQTDTIIIDAKSGVSGAGRTPLKTTLFCELYNSIKPYNFGNHRHIPEIEQELSIIAQEAITVSFHPHIIPINRGILSTMYTVLKRPLSKNELHQLYINTWAKHPWIRVLPIGTLPETRYVQDTMFCDIGLHLSPCEQKLTIVSAIDNLCRGASGQAIASANLMFGLPVETGLSLKPNIL